MTRSTRHSQGRSNPGARSRRRLGAAVLVAVLAATLAAPMIHAEANADAALAASLCERIERLVDDLFGRVTAALRPERLGQKPDADPSATTTSTDVTLDDGAALRPERLGGKSD